MQPALLKSARERAGLTQQQAANRLGVSQAYVALLENGQRRVTPQLARKLVRLYRLPATALPLDNAIPADSATVAGALAALGYPGFRQLRPRPKKNPAAVLLAAISADELETRVIEALPWVVVRYHDLPWPWVMAEAKRGDVQNRLGFIVTLGRRIAEKQRLEPARTTLLEVEQALGRARLAREDVLCHASLSEPERQWLRASRPADACFWNLLTDLDADRLPYAA